MSTNQAGRDRMAGVGPRPDAWSETSSERSQAFADAYLQHGRAVFRVARGMCGAARAEEVTQAVFVQLWRHPEQFDSATGTLRAHLVTVAWGKAVDDVRVEGRRRRERRGNNWAISAGDDGVDGGVLEREPATLIADAVSSLPLVQREALAVAFYGQCTYNQTAVILGQPEGTTKSRIRSGLRRLRSALGDVAIERDTFVPIR